MVVPGVETEKTYSVIQLRTDWLPLKDTTIRDLTVSMAMRPSVSVRRLPKVLKVLALLAATSGQELPAQVTACPTVLLLLQYDVAAYWAKNLMLDSSAVLMVAAVGIVS